MSWCDAYGSLLLFACGSLILSALQQAGAPPFADHTHDCETKATVVDEDIDIDSFSTKCSLHRNTSLRSLCAQYESAQVALNHSISRRCLFAKQIKAKQVTTMSSPPSRSDKRKSANSDPANATRSSVVLTPGPSSSSSSRQESPNRPNTATTSKSSSRAYPSSAQTAHSSHRRQDSWKSQSWNSRWKQDSWHEEWSQTGWVKVEEDDSQPPAAKLKPSTSDRKSVV